MDLALPLATLAIAILLLIFAYRGRRIDDHPICRRCRFDLTGLPQTSDNCPECGTNIRQPHTTRIGNRERRSRLLLAGYFITLPSLLFLGVFLYARFAGVRWIEYEPMWMLHSSFTSTDPAKSQPAFAEIRRRFNARLLSESDLAPTMDTILDWQGNAAVGWDSTCSSRPMSTRGSPYLLE